MLLLIVPNFCCNKDTFDDELVNSSDQGNFQEKFQGYFTELLWFLIDHNENVKALTLKNSSEILD